MSIISRLSVAAIVLLCLVAATRPATGESFAKWSRIDLTLQGPASKGLGSPNPFAVKLDVRFTSPTGKTFQIPGFYDGDGKGELDGDVWRVRFSAGELGEWKYETRSETEALNGRRGVFSVAEASDDVRGFWKWGRLESASSAGNGVRYLKFRDGPYWLKAGCDDPENFLGAYRNYNTLAKRKKAVDYLAEKGINSLYIMTHNLGGDDRDVWPWIGKTAREAMRNGGKQARFDVARLEQWRLLFEHMQTRGVVPYLILEDDSAWKAYDHERYWREIIARFGYLPALVFNMGEEHNENYRLDDGLAMAKRFRRMDPFDHPLGIHNVNRPTDKYVASSAIDFTAIQTGSPGSRRGLKHATDHNAIAIDWIRRCEKLGARPLMVNFDEGRPELDRRAWWSAYLGGGVWEAHVLQPYDRPMSAWEEVWTELGGARAFMETLPFWKMAPDNERVKAGDAFCLSDGKSTFAFYLPAGGTIDVQLPDGDQFNVAWWNPANGFDGKFERQARANGGRLTLKAPAKGDWALRIAK